MQPRQLREKIKALKQEINMLNSQTDILKDKLESRDLELEYLKSRTEKLKIYLKESSERKNIITKQKNEWIFQFYLSSSSHWR